MQAGTRLGHYEIIEPLGAGGMGEVYRAHDTNLKREVAIKVLPEAMAADQERLARLQREAHLLASLNHVNIASIHSLERDAGTRFLVLELVQGETLAERLKRGSLPVQEALEAAKQIAEALEGAHEKGIIHRDLKPANVMLTPGGNIKVLDFGLAKALEVQGAEGEVTHSPTITVAGTKAGVILGTAAYMSPEQARGQVLDKRSDIWSFGCVVYESLTGIRAFDRDTLADTLSAILEHEPNWDALPVATPESVRTLLSRCLQKIPHRRLHDIADARIEIEDVLLTLSGVRSPALLPPERRKPARRSAWASPAMIFGGAAVIVVALVALNVADLRDRAVGMLTGWAPGAATDAIDSVVILPLVNLSGDPEREFFADGMTDELIARLQAIGGLKVISRTSAMSYKNAPKPLPVIGMELGVTAVVEGSVRETGDRVQIDLRLLRAATEERLWARSFDRPINEVPALQNELALAIAAQLDVELTPEEELRLSVAQSTDPQALEEYLLGLALSFQRTARPLFGAIQHFERAIDAEPEFALAYGAMAEAYATLGSYMILPPEQASSMAQQFAEQALQIDPNQFGARTALGWVKMSYDWNWQDAELAFLRAISVNPGLGRAHQQYGAMLLYAGRLEEALREFRRAVELDPLSSRSQRGLAEVLAYAGRFDESIKTYEAAIDADPTDANLWLIGSIAHLIAGDFETAVIWAEEANRLVPNAPFFQGVLGANYAGAGRRAEAVAIVEALERVATDTYVDPALIGLVHAHLGDLDTAMDWIEKGFEGRSGMMIHITPLFPMLEGDPRYEEIQTAVGVNY